MEKDIKQVIIIRKDLNMRKGKMVAQGAHSSEKVFFDMMSDPMGIGAYILNLPDNQIGEDMITWIETNHKKITCSVTSEVELMDLYQEAKAAGLPCSYIWDDGLTEFKGVKTLTSVAIGPADAELINPLTKNLKLL